MGCFIDPSAFSPNEARKLRRQLGDLQSSLLLTGLSPSSSGGWREGVCRPKPWLLPANFGQLSCRQMIQYCLPGCKVAGHYRYQDFCRTNGLSATQVSIPFAAAQLLQPAFFKSKPRSFQLSVCNLGQLESIAKDDDPSFRQIQTSTAGWINCLRYMPSMKLLPGSHCPFIEPSRTSNYCAFIKPDGGGALAGFTTTRPGSQSLGQGGAAFRKQAAMRCIWAATVARFHQLARREWGLSSNGCDLPTSCGELRAGALDLREPPGSCSHNCSNAFKGETACGLISKGVNSREILIPAKDPIVLSAKSL